MKIALVAVMVLAGFHALEATANTVSIVETRTPGCQEFLSVSGAVSANCEYVNGTATGTATASAGPGIVSVSAISQASVVEIFPGGPFRVERSGLSTAIARFDDMLTVSGISAGTLLFPVDTFGSYSHGVVPSALSSGFLTYGVSGVSFGSTSSSFNGSRNSTGSSIPERNLETASILFDSGGVRLSYFASTQVHACSFGIPQGVRFCEVSGDFSSSLRLLGVTILDAQGEDVTSQVTVSSSSGFNYIEGATPHTVPAPVPTPASGVMLLFAVFGFARLRKLGQLNK